MNVDTQEQVANNAAFLVIFGCLLASLGVIAIGAPLAAGLAVEVIVGIMVLTRGLMQLYYGFKVRQWGHRFGSYMGMGSIAVALLSVAVGVLLLVSPMTGLRFLSMVLAAYLIVAGGFEVLHAIELSAARGWGIVALSGMAGVVLGILIWQQWPLSGRWATGVLVGLSFIVSGGALALLGWTGQNASVRKSNAGMPIGEGTDAA